MRPISALPPGPRLPAAMQMVGFWTRPLSFLERCRARYGKRFTIRLPFTPPFVMLTDPDEVKQVFTAPPDVLRPGQGARVLEPVVGSNSVILLDEAAHMEQRKLMLPAFHGERMERLTGLMEEVATEEVAARWVDYLPQNFPAERTSVEGAPMQRGAVTHDPSGQLRSLPGSRDRTLALLHAGASGNTSGAVACGFRHGRGLGGRCSS